MLYRYMTLSYKESLGDADVAAVPFGVVVETNRYVYYLGFGLTGSETTITGQILRNFPEVLKEQIVAAVRDSRRQKRDTLDVLRQALSWNVSASAPKRGVSFRSIERIANRLFAQKVEGTLPAPADRMTAIEPTRRSFELRLRSLVTA